MRRTMLTAALSLALVSTVAAQSTFHGDNARTGVYQSPAPRTLHGVKWTFKTGAAVVSSPAIVAGTVYIGSSDGNLYALDQATGQQKWKFGTDGPLVSSPAVANGLVFFLSYDGVFYAVSADSGKVRWTFSTGGERRFEARGIHGLSPAGQMIADPMDVFLSSAVVAGGKVFFGSSDGHLYALNATTGVVQWSFATNDVIHASPAIANGMVYVGSWDSYLYAVDAETGQQKWRFKAGEDPVSHNQVGFQSSPTIVNGVVYVGCRDGHVYAIDALTGVRKWDYSTSQSWVNGTPAVLDGVVYVGTSDTHRFHALDAATGVSRYVVNADALIFGSAAIADGVAFVGAFNGELLAIDTHSGKVEWRFRTDGAKADPLKLLSPNGRIANDALGPVFHNFLDMSVYLYRMYSIGAILSSPVVDGGVIFFGSADGLVYAIN